jgi:gliding motility-associated-like protein
MRSWLLLIVGFFTLLHVSGQDFSNKGKEFWLTYPSHVNGTSSVMGIYITSTENATVTINAAGTTLAPVPVIANQVSRIFLGGVGNPTNVNVYLTAADGIKPGAGIKISSDKDVVVYSHIIFNRRSGATLVLPTNVLGTEYLVPTYQSADASGGAGSAKSSLAVVATQSNTKIVLTPTITAGTRAAGRSDTIELVNAGDCYQLLSNQLDDLSGTTIKSISSGTSGCKPIAVFSGNTWATIGCDPIRNSNGSIINPSGGDNLFQQVTPIRSWGKQFVTAPFKNRSLDIYRIFVLSNNTIVSVTENGITRNLGPAEFNPNKKCYEINSGNPLVIKSDKQISVVQYITSQTCSQITPRPFADPEMVILNPVEQTLNDITFFSAHANFVPNGQTNVSQHYLNVVIDKKFQSTLRIDNSLPTGTFFNIPGTNYVYLQEDLTISSQANPVHRIKADTGFMAIVYGYGDVESYGYNAGSNVKDLTQYVSVKNTFGTVNFPSTCKDAPFNLSITLPFKPLKITWDFKGNADLGANPPAISNPDNSTLLADDSIPNPNDPSKKLYTYFLKNSDGTLKVYKSKQKGSIPIDVYVINPTPDGCTGEQLINFELKVFDPPTVGLKRTSNGCLDDPVSLEAIDIQTDGRPVIKYIWGTEPSISDTLITPQISKVFTADGQKSISLKIITDIGCISSESVSNFSLTSKPTPDFELPSITCLGKAFTIQDKSVPVANSTLDKWEWEYLNVPGSTSDIFDKNSPSKNPVKTFSQSLVNVKLTVTSNSGCKSSVTKDVQLNPNPVVDFDIQQSICLPAGIGKFTSANSSISDNSQSQFSYLWNFGDNQSTISNPNTSNISDPVHIYSSAGNINVSLKITSNKGCENSLDKSFTVYPQPVAKIDFKKEICLRESFVFSDQTDDGSGNGLVAWSWKFNNTDDYSTKTFSVLPSVAGSFQISFSGTSSKGCISNVINETIIVNPLPLAEFKMNSPACESEAVTFTQEAIANVGTLSRWNWKLGTGTASQNYIDANAVISRTFPVWGDQQISLMVENSKGCKSDTLVKTVRINPKPKVGFTLPEVCLNDAFAEFQSTSTLADNSQSISYVWDFGDPNATTLNPNTGTGALISHKYSAARNYSVNLKATSSAGCVANFSQSFTVNGATPKADFAVLKPDSLCSNTNVGIQNLSSVDFGTVSKLEIYWDYINTPTVFVTDENPTPNKIYTNLYADFLNQPTKTFTIRVRAFSGGTCVDDELKTITVNGSPKVTLQPLQGICLETPPRRLNEASFTDVAGISAGLESFTGKGVSTAGIFDPSSAGAGTHLITYRFTSSKGCFAETSGNIVVWPRPIANFSVSNVNCEKNAIVFTNSSVANAGNLVTWNWNFGDGSGVRSVTNGNQQSYTYSLFNSYTVTLDVVTNNGCTSIPRTQIIKVNPLPVVNFDLPKVCLPEGKAIFPNMTDIPDGSKDLITYLWTYGDPLDPTPTVVKDGIHYFRSLRSYTIKLVATSNNGCKDSLSRLLSDVFPQPKAGFRSLDSVCLGKEIQYSDTSTGFVRPIVEWNWDFGNGVTDNTKNPLYEHRATGTFPVSLWVKSSEGCISDTSRKNITIHPYPKISAGPDLFVLDDGQKQIQANATGSALVYNWSPATYLSATNILQPIISMPQQDVVYTLSVTGRGACTSKDDVAITVLKLPKPPNTFTPNGDGINDLWDIRYLDQYPGCILEVFTTQGQLVYRSVGYVNKWDGTNNGKPLPFGTYYYVIDPKSGRSKIAGYVTIIK